MTKHYNPRIFAAIICVILISFTAQAQQQMRTRPAEATPAFREGSVSVMPIGFPVIEDPSRAACDTFNLYAYNHTWSIQHYYTGSPNWGSVNGFNSFGDKAKAQYFANTNGNTYCFGGRFAFSRATAINVNKTVTINVWNVSGGNPGTVLGSVTVPMSKLIADVNGNYFTDVHFTTPANTGGQPFFMGVDFSNLTLGDSLGLQSNLNGQTVPSGVWEYTSSNVWTQYNTGSSWALNISIAAFPFMTNVLPDAAYTQSTTNTCSGYPVTFDASTSVQTQLLWKFQNGTPATATTVNPSVTWATAGTYTVKLYVLGGSCNSIDSAQSTVTIIQSPNPAATATPAAFCQGQSTTLNALNGISYTWTGFTPGQNPVVATPTTNTTYTVSVTASNGCSATQNVPVTVYATPNPNAISSVPVACVGTSVLISATPGFSSYTWNTGQNTAAFNYVINDTTTFFVTVSDSHGCLGTDSVTVNSDPCTGITDNTDAGLLCYPNPATDEIFIRNNNPLSESPEYYVMYNATGQLIRQDAINNGTQHISLIGLEQGIYQLSVYYKNRVQTFKIQKL